MGRVLLVEDDPIARDAIAEFLKTFDYVVESASSHPEALRKIRHNPPDLVLVNLCAPPAATRVLVDECRRGACRTADTLATVKTLSEARNHRQAAPALA